MSFMNIPMMPLLTIFKLLHWTQWAVLIDYIITSNRCGLLTLHASCISTGWYTVFNFLHILSLMHWHSHSIVTKYRKWFMTSQESHGIIFCTLRSCETCRRNMLSVKFYYWKWNYNSKSLLHLQSPCWACFYYQDKLPLISYA